MSAKVTRIVFNYQGFDALRKTPSVVADITARANRIAAAAGDGVEVKIGATPSRAKATIYTDSIEASLAEATDKTLSTAIDQGR